MFDRRERQPHTQLRQQAFHQSQLILTYAGEVHEQDAAMIREQLDLAHRYNESLAGGALVAAGERLPLSDESRLPSAFVYEDLLRVNTAGFMARIKIPAIQVDLPIYHGTSDETLLQGVGHLEGTALPVGGANTHSVLTAHRGLASAELFSNLNHVDMGDTFTIEVFGEVLSYRVVETAVVEPDETQALFPQVGRDLVTLVTCTPLGINSHRILVTGERIIPTPQSDLRQAGASPDVPGPPWWAVGLGATTTVLVGYVWRMGFAGRQRS